MIKLFSAFAGYGTDNFALRQIGIEFECVGFSEVDKYAIKCFEQNHCKECDFNTPEGWKRELLPKNYGDICKIDWAEVSDFDLLTGGFPCQDVSVAGKQDLDNGRTILGFELTRALKIKQPKYFLFENVKGLMSKKFETFREELLRQWREAGYNIYYQILNTKDYGVPQSRSRVFFIGIRKDIKQDFKFPEKQELRFFVKDILETEVDNKYLLNEVYTKRLIESTDLKKSFSAINPDIAITQTARQYSNFKGNHIIQLNNPKHSTHRLYSIEGIARTLRGSAGGLGAKTGAYVIPVLTPNRLEKRQNGRRFKNDSEPMFTITGQDRHGVLIINNQSFVIRKLTPLECFRLQGFLNDEVNLQELSDNQCYKLAGNGQSVNVVKEILYELLKYEEV